MSNDGFQPYLDITTRAAKEGGVEAMLANVQRAAVLAAAPRILLAGVVAGGVLVEGARRLNARLVLRREQATLEARAAFQRQVDDRIRTEYPVKS